MQNCAPGARILCRDAEWLVKAVTVASDGGRVIEAIGVSEFIQGKRAQFIEELEADLQVLKPEETQLVADTSSGYVHSFLFVEAHLRQMAPDDGRLYQGQQAAMDALPYQLWPAYKALGLPRQRILIADAVGLGKTLECGILTSELIRRGRGRRILVVTTKAMMVQFQKEFWSRFTIPLVRLDSTTIQRIRTRIPGNHNPFHYYDRSIISVDTLKQDREYRSYLENAHWDIIIIDEAHNVARRGGGLMGSAGVSKRAKLAERLSSRSDTLILLSATPHDGRAESFASLMNMLDPTAIANESDYTQDNIRDLYVRRFKKDVLQDLKQHVPEREVEPVKAIASPAEEQVFERLNALSFESIDSRRKASQLFKTTLLKAMLSSPAACLQTVKNRIKRLKKEDMSPADVTDRQQLEDLRDAIARVTPSDFAKYQALLQLIRKDFGWKGKDPTDRLVIFTERLDTLKFLAVQLAEDLKLKKGAIAQLDGRMGDVDQNQIVEAFGQESSKVRVLIATEVASEGLNLHYLSYRLIHFDIPWSLMTLQQRNGRIDRYGQSRQPQIRYLLTRSVTERMDEVARIIEVLIRKDDQAIKNIGDPSVFMGVFDAQKEAEITAVAVESGTAAAFEQAMETKAEAAAAEVDLFALFTNPDLIEVSEEVQAQPQVETGQLTSLFESTYDYATTAIQALETEPPNLNINPQERFIELQMPAELEKRYARLPKEIKPDDKSLLTLTDRPQAVMAAMDAARREEKAWPQQQYLWDLHPLVEWLTDKCLFRFGRHQAPVVQLPKLAPGEGVFLLFGSFPNRRGAPMLSRWAAVVFNGDEFQRIETFEEMRDRTNLGKQSIPNPGEMDVTELEPLREKAIAQAKAYFLAEHEVFEAALAKQLEEQRSRLDALKGEHLTQLALRFDDGQSNGQLDAVKRQRRQGAVTHIDRIFQDYRNWVEMSMTTEPEPFIKLVAVLTGSR
ncbi:MAG: DEAD/DEAH box helicase [Cyanobacteria bacterium J06634_5]